ncbi:uncharacterized protein LOC110465174 [Mizuhopecten yessoensis]|uniref:uncharacterized protein LOC110465174 n=1 Tax=Mizuhopecten yessoensis TaxID=6573 RepID=UPI000B45CCA8|nr:uncharacterized protein LOC110465174 [Mizuhopecten yessoensis]
MEMYRVIHMFVLRIFLLDVDKVHACFCPISHPQTDYCHLSSFALVGSVSDFVDSNYDRRFNVIVQFMLKVPEGYTHRKRLKLKTYKGPILCELNLLPGIRYLITGYVNSDDEYLVNSCMWAED